MALGYNSRISRKGILLKKASMEEIAYLKWRLSGEIKESIGESLGYRNLVFLLEGCDSNDKIVRLVKTEILLREYTEFYDRFVPQ